MGTISLTLYGFDFETLVGKIRQAILDSDLLTVSEINPQKILASHGYNAPKMRQIFFFHPRLMKIIINHNIDAAIAAPIKFLGSSSD